VYTGSSKTLPPQLLPGEKGITKQSIRVKPYKDETLEPAARINFGKPFAVEHNFKVTQIGVVDEAHMHLLTNYFLQAMCWIPK
jgi:hypothetical protein